MKIERLAPLTVDGKGVWACQSSMVILPKHSQMNLKDLSAANSQFRCRDIASNIHIPDPKMHSQCSHRCPPYSGRSFGQQTMVVKVKVKQMKFRDRREDVNVMARNVSKSLWAMSVSRPM